MPAPVGLLMVSAVAYGVQGFAAAAAAAAAAAVLVSVWWRPGATLAVLLGVLTVLLAEPAPVHTALAGLAAVSYLIAQQGLPTPATAMFAVGFGAAATAALALPVSLQWVPLAAPLALLAAYAVAVWPFVAGPRRQPGSERAESVH